ncbi:undecaprenyl-phosphate glucose phosphotransferase [Hymenobacter cavernae]|uniref:Undecaprenyl-phosphate glucose phosphotransferase n=1 Tax=Hymenobacter cavernae TaxID=2044852 RepID=A0ABQ1TS07_9BACT|nr:undecaprenyl-phosphate glucose phosphotransferase [Hymenobacter cavernae]GGF01633.1 undecaprenyl-phosphate glucose phosphotransferase [Hymenobacter cavernae]
MERYTHYTNANRVILPVLDVLIIFGAFRLAGYAYLGNWQFAGYYPLFYAVFALLWWILSVQYANVYRAGELISYPERFRNLARTFLLHAGLLLSGAMLLDVYWMPARYIVIVYSFVLAGVVAGRFLLAFFRRAYQRHLARPYSRFVIVGTSPSGQELYRTLTSYDPVGNQFRGFFTDEAAPSNLQPLVKGGIAELKEFCKNEQIDEIYFALPLDQRSLIQDLAKFADDHFVSFRIIPDFKGTVQTDVNVYYYDHMPILTVRQNPLAFRPNQLAKRVFDIAFSSLVIFGIFPIIMPVLALLIKLDSPGPIFFKQLRPGKRNQLFPCYKLRTMRTDLSGTELQATKGDARVTRIGRILRKTSLDELPQFFNVLLGHMSVVGPRPNMISQLEEYSKHIHTYPLRHAVTPGITGYAQVNGYRGETRAPQAMEKRVEYDLKYVENWSFKLDMKIIGQTVWNMVKGEKNAY